MNLLAALPQSPDAHVLWPVEPRFHLNHEDRRYQDFHCGEPGQAILADGDRQLIVKFDLDWPTDIASTPLIFQIFVPQIGPHSPAAILHDRLIEMGMKRSVARRWMWIQLQALPLVPKWRRYAMYAGVWLWDTFAVPLGFKTPGRGFKW